MTDLGRLTQCEGYPAACAFIQQKGEDLFRAAIAEQLPQRLFMPGDAVPFDQRQEIARSIAAERRLGEVRIGRNIAIGRGLNVGEIAPPATGNQDLAPRFVGMVDQQHPPPALARRERTEQPRRARTQNDDIELARHHASISAANASATLIPSTAAERMPPA